jgi:hypothetical protein
MTTGLTHLKTQQASRVPALPITVPDAKVGIHASEVRGTLRP